MNFKDIAWPETLFVTGIGTDIGKSYATGWLAACMAKEGINVITQKFVQTGCTGISIDIECHRRLQGIPLQTVDLTGITAPLSYTYPASPQLAAEIDGKPLDTGLATEATRILHRQYSHVLIEGAGGIMVPLTRQYLTIDYIADNRLPVILTTHGGLGSISDTLLNVTVMLQKGIEIFAIIYNPYFDKDKIIAEDARSYMIRRIAEMSPATLWLDMPS